MRPASSEFPENSGDSLVGGDLSAFACPDCGQAVPPTSGPVGNVLQCPDCGRQFFASIDEAGPASAVDASDPTASASRLDREAELDALHIQQVKVLRRGLHRTRNYWVVLLVAVVVAAAQMAWLTVGRVYNVGWGFKATGYVAAAIACVLACPMILRRMVDIDHELRAMRQAEPDTPPDLSALSDGSQQLKNLEAMNLERDEEV